MFILHHHVQRCRTCGTAEAWSCLYLAAHKGTGTELVSFKGDLPPDAIVHKTPPMHTTVPTCLECHLADANAASRSAAAYARFEEARQRKRIEAATPPPSAQKRFVTIDDLA